MGGIAYGSWRENTRHHSDQTIRPTSLAGGNGAPGEKGEYWDECGPTVHSQPFLTDRIENICKFAVIERRPFIRECLARGLSSCSTIAVESFSCVQDVLTTSTSLEASLMILSVIRLSEAQSKQELMSLFQALPNVPTIVLAHEEDMTGALDALGHGARGYIPVSLGFDIAIEAMRFVNAGGTYVPAECLLAARQAPTPSGPPAQGSSITNRELAVVQALRQGKPNKIIAFELNMCESTVKVHVRHLMKKLRARNRTEVAMKAGEFVDPINCAMQTQSAIGDECASATIAPPCGLAVRAD